MEEAKFIYETPTYVVQQLDNPQPLTENNNVVGMLNYVVINRDTGASEYFSEHLPGAIGTAIKMDEYVINARKEKNNGSVVSLVSGETTH